MIGICTDSNAQLPVELTARFGIEVVPMTVTIDGVEFAEGVDLDADAFYARIARGVRPEISTSQPSPGAFAQAYANLVARGATEILSIHVTESVSGTLNSARLAAPLVAVPVHLVDSGTLSFGIGCCVWEAADAIAAGAEMNEALAVVTALVPRIGTVFTIGALDLAEQGGRVAVDHTTLGDGTPIFTMRDGALAVIGHAHSTGSAADRMADYAVAWGTGLKAAVGLADRGAAEVTRLLEERLTAAPEVSEVVRYRVGPSVGAHTGPGTAGAFFFSKAR
jgi:DegV family protein with EDD domain